MARDNPYTLTSGKEPTISEIGIAFASRDHTPPSAVSELARGRSHLPPDASRGAALPRVQRDFCQLKGVLIVFRSDRKQVAIYRRR